MKGDIHDSGDRQIIENEALLIAQTLAPAELLGIRSRTADGIMRVAAPAYALGFYRGQMLSPDASKMRELEEILRIETDSKVPIFERVAHLESALNRLENHRLCYVCPDNDAHEIARRLLRGEP